MKVVIGKFTRGGIESDLGFDLEATVQAALSYYRGKLESGRTPLMPPPFLLRGETIEPDAAIDFPIDEATEEIVVREARKLDVAPERLAAHAVLSYLAELDFLGAAGPKL